MNALFKWFYNRTTVIKVLIYAIGFSSWAYIFGYLLYIDGYINSFIGNYFLAIFCSISLVNLITLIFAIAYIFVEGS